MLQRMETGHPGHPGRNAQRHVVEVPTSEAEPALILPLHVMASNAVD